MNVKAIIAYVGLWLAGLVMMGLVMSAWACTELCSTSKRTMLLGTAMSWET